MTKKVMLAWIYKLTSYSLYLELMQNADLETFDVLILAVGKPCFKTEFWNHIGNPQMPKGS